MEAITLPEATRRWKRIAATLVEMSKRVLQPKETEILDLLKSQLYIQGVDGYGDPLRQYRSDEYAAEKHDMNPAPGYGRPDLYKEGNFYRGFKIEWRTDSMFITSTDSKTEKLINGRYGYGWGVFKLGSETVSVIRTEILQPGLIHMIADETGATIG